MSLQLSRPGSIALVLGLSLPLSVLASCRESSPPASVVLPANAFGANGCITPGQAFGPAPMQVPLAVLSISSASQVTAATSGELLYATGADGTVVEIDVSDPLAPMERELLAPGDVAALLATEGIRAAPSLSGIAVASDGTLLVIEHTADVILAVGRGDPGVVELYAGLPSLVPGFADGTRAEIVSEDEAFPRARFSFEQPCQLLPLAPDDVSGQVFVVDSGNHALRLISGEEVTTLVGAGTPGTIVGDFSTALFDTPSGITVNCDGTLCVSELGAFGEGQVLRIISILATPDFEGRVDGVVTILVGDKIDATTEGVPAAGTGMLAQVSMPSSPLATTGGELYWIDSGTGVLRRLAGDLVDCPLAADCATAVTAPSFTPGGTHSLTQTPGGALYVLDAGAGVLYLLPE